jgi:hypothetical protein
MWYFAVLTAPKPATVAATAGYALLDTQAQPPAVIPY